MLSGIAALIGLASCAQIVGANFDVESQSTTGGHGGSATSVSSSSSSTGTGGGGPITLTTEVNPYDIELDDTYVYWTSSGKGAGQGAVRRIAKDGSGKVEDLATSLTNPNRLLLSGGYAYFSETDNVNGAVKRVSTSKPFTIEPIATAIPSPVGLAIDGNALFYTSYVPGMGGTNIVYRVTVSPTIGGPLAFAQVPGQPSFLAIHGGFLWGTSPPAGLLWQVPLNAMPIYPADAASAPSPGINCVVSTPAGILTGQYNDMASVVLFLSSGQQTVATNQNVVGEVAGDASYAYWAEFGGGHVWRGGYEGGTPQLMANAPNANGLTLDADSIYFTTYSIDGAIIKMPKPP